MADLTPISRRKMTSLIILFSRITIHEGMIYILDRLQVYEIHVKLINMIDNKK